MKLWVEQAILTGASSLLASLIQEFTQVPALPPVQQASILQLQGWLQVRLHGHTLL